MAINPLSRAPQAQLGPQTSMAVEAPPVTPRAPNMLETFLAALMEGGNGGGGNGILRSSRKSTQTPEETALLRAQAAQANATADNTQMDARRKHATEAFTQAAYGFYDPKTGQQVPGTVDNLRSEGYGAATPDAILSLANRFGIPKDEAEAIAARMRTAYAQTPTSPLASTFTQGVEPYVAAPVDPALEGRPQQAAPSRIADVFTGGSAGLGGMPAVGGAERESMLAGLDVAAGGNPWNQNQGVDVHRLQSNIDKDLQNNLDQQQIAATASEHVARTQADANIRAAQIREAGETARAAAKGQQDSLTTVFAPPTATNEELTAAYYAAVPAAAREGARRNPASAGLENQVIGRARQYMLLQYMQPEEAVQKAANDYLSRGEGRGGGNVYHPNPPAIRPVAPQAPRRVTARDVGGGMSVPTPGSTAAPAPAAGAPIRVTDAASYARVPAGAEYIDPQGNRRTKGR